MAAGPAAALCDFDCWYESAATDLDASTKKGTPLGILVRLAFAAIEPSLTGRLVIAYRHALTFFLKNHIMN